MTVEVNEVLWLNQIQQLSLNDLTDLSGLSVAELHELADAGVITPVDAQATEWTFCASCLVTARIACRLRTDFELDAHGLTLALKLIERIDGLQEQLRALQAQLTLRQH